MSATYKVYWTSGGEVHTQMCTGIEEFTELTANLYAKQYSGEDISFIASASVVAGEVGKRGVDVTGPDYDWKKRR